jgi:MarR family
VRVSELAGLLQWERSRISHDIKRMEDRGLVERGECSEDGRGAFVVIAPSGPCCDRGGCSRPRHGGEAADVRRTQRGRPSPQS